MDAVFTANVDCRRSGRCSISNLHFGTDRTPGVPNRIGKPIKTFRNHFTCDKIAAIAQCDVFCFRIDSNDENPFPETDAETLSLTDGKTFETVMWGENFPLR